MTIAALFGYFITLALGLGVTVGIGCVVLFPLLFVLGNVNQSTASMPRYHHKLPGRDPNRRPVTD